MNCREVIARLTYGAYIMHPIVLFVIVWDNTQVGAGAVLESRWCVPGRACGCELDLFGSPRGACVHAVALVLWQMLRYTRIQIGAAFAGAWLLSYACAAVLFLFVEKPCMQLEALLFKRLGAGGGGSE